ncbi:MULTISPECIES: hypothetical protein [unclassified Streptomyces]|uniref:hypothetical protein n=1 Tax=unclassified Streptomyces TaxID=2593676 RepID=UPI002741EADD|nr:MULTISPECIES: hypothetical protein [unclassified Streptomyces]
MTTLRQRKTNRKAVLRSLYEAVAHNRPEVSGAVLRDELGLPDEDLSAACTYLADDGLISVDWTSHRTPAAVALTHEGVRLMEELEEEQEDREKAEETQSDG